MRHREYLRAEYLLAAIIFAATAVLYFGDPNTDFIGDDDYLVMSGFAGFSRLLSPWIYYGHGGIAAYAKDIVISLFLIRYGPLPAAFYGTWLAGWDILQLPFSLYYAHIPLALLAALVPVFFFRILRNMTFGVGVATVGAMILASSPIFFGATRGLATYWAVGAIFAQVTTIWALQRLERDPTLVLIPSLAIFNMVVSDPLFFLTLPALLLAFAARRVALIDAWHRPREALRKTLAGASPLRSAWIWGPGAAFFVLTVLSTLAIALANLYQATPQPMLTRLMAVSGHHGDFAIPVPDPVLLFRQAAMTFGEPTIFVFAAALIVVFRQRQSIFVGIEGWFALFCTIGFGILFYVQQPGGAVLLYYQLYIVVALLLFLSLAFRAGDPRVFKAVLILLLCTSALGTAARIWDAPTKIDSEAFPTLIYEMRFPEQGTKALGLLVRDALIENKSATVSVFVAEPRWATSVLAFSGLTHRAAYFRYRFGFEVPVQTKASADDLTRGECDAPISMTITGQNALASQSPHLQCIMDGTRQVAALVLIGLKAQVARPNLQVSELNAEFDRRYPRLFDIFPPH